MMVINIIVKMIKMMITNYVNVVWVDYYDDILLSGWRLGLIIYKMKKMNSLDLNNR